MTAVTMRDLLEAGIHFGHQTRRWNPKMKRYIFGERNGIYIIDLQKTMRELNKARAVVRDTVAKGGTVLFVGTKKQAQEIVAREADRCGMHYMNSRWLGGTLTNFKTVQSSVSKLLRLEKQDEEGKLDKYSKKEAARLRRNKNKLAKTLTGLKTMNKLPSVMFVIDAKKEAIAIKEAERLGIPCIAVVDTNADPDVVPMPVPGNDDAIRAISLFCKAIADAAIEGQSVRQKTQAEEAALKGEGVDAETAAMLEEEETAKADAPAEEVTEEATTLAAASEEAAETTGE